MHGPGVAWFSGLDPRGCYHVSHGKGRGRCCGMQHGAALKGERTRSHFHTETESVAHSTAGPFSPPRFLPGLPCLVSRGRSARANPGTRGDITPLPFSSLLRTFANSGSMAANSSRKEVLRCGPCRDRKVGFLSFVCFLLTFFSCLGYPVTPQSMNAKFEDCQPREAGRPKCDLLLSIVGLFG
ncbi:hypothetical protein F5Y10DRAFT_74441 [Nemania abortiva]|nr:hypothetical protein F5Y10DRAFT_74441 [Nemania abortiva]